MDTILLLTNSHYYIVTYDDELDCLTDYLKIPISHVYAIDIGKMLCQLICGGSLNTLATVKL